MRYLLTICTMLTMFLAKAQDSSFTLVKTIKGDIVEAALDPLNNIYSISSTGQVKKWNANGDSMGVYNQVRNSGQLYSIDVSNPLRPLLFYKDFGTLVILDRFLSNRSVVDLRRLRILQPGAAATSYDNNIWVFDELDNKLRKIDEQGNILLETPDFRQVFNENLRPSRIIDDNGLVYLADSSKGVFVFDIYGAFKKKISVTGWMALAVRDPWLIYQQNNQLKALHMQNYTERALTLPSSASSTQSFISYGGMILFTRDSAAVFRYRF